MAVTRFEFVPQRKSVHWLAVVLLSASAGSLYVAFDRHRAMEARIEEMAVKKAALEASDRKQRADALAAMKKPDLRKPLQKILAPLNYPWNQVLLELEAANGERVNVVKLEANYSDRVVNLVVVGSTYESIQALTERLKDAGGETGNWRVTSISRVPTGLRASIEGRDAQ